MSQQPLSGKRPYIDECQHEISTGGKPEEGRDSPLGVPSPCVVFDPKQESRLWRKVDLRLMPMIALMYLLCFMDRGKSMICHPWRDDHLHLGFSGNIGENRESYALSQYRVEPSS